MTTWAIKKKHFYFIKGYLTFMKMSEVQNTRIETTLNNLAGLYNDMGASDKALPLYQRALEIIEKVLGPQHPSVATSLNNLAFLYKMIGRNEEALFLLERSLKIFESKLGPAHPNFKTTEQNIQALKAKMKEK